MTTVELIRDTAVKHQKGDVVTVTEAEAKRLIAFNLAKPAEPKAKKTKK